MAVGQHQAGPGSAAGLCRHCSGKTGDRHRPGEGTGDSQAEGADCAKAGAQGSQCLQKEDRRAAQAPCGGPVTNAVQATHLTRRPQALQNPLGRRAQQWEHPRTEVIRICPAPPWGRVPRPPPPTMPRARSTASSTSSHARSPADGLRATDEARGQRPLIAGRCARTHPT